MNTSIQISGLTLGAYRIDNDQQVHPGVWEVHPGDEVLLMCSGALDVVTRHGDHDQLTMLGAGRSVIVPAGVWHRLALREPGLLVALTPRDGTRRSATPRIASGRSARLRRMLVSAVLGAVVFGGWAYAANFDFPDHRLQSALAQGAFSFVFSLVVVGFAELLFARLAGRASRVALSIAIPWATSLLGGALVHLAAHTPSIALTLLVPGSVGLVFGTLYVLNLGRLDGAMRSRAAASRGATQPARR